MSFRTELLKLACQSTQQNIENHDNPSNTQHPHKLQKVKELLVHLYLVLFKDFVLKYTKKDMEILSQLKTVFNSVSKDPRDEANQLSKDPLIPDTLSEAEDTRKMLHQGFKNNLQSFYKEMNNKDSSQNTNSDAQSEELTKTNTDHMLHELESYLNLIYRITNLNEIC